MLTQGGGNSEEAAWEVVMSAVKKLFEEYFAPVRGLPMSDYPKADDPESTRRFLGRAAWSSLQMHRLTKEMVDTNIQNHPIISSAYTEWGLLNSGKPTAEKAIKKVEAQESTVKECASTVEKLQKKVDSLTDKIEDVRKIAQSCSSKIGNMPGGKKGKGKKGANDGNQNDNE